MRSAFDKLARPVQKWIRSQGWSELRQIQVDAIHAILDSEDDLIISASTATGKTEAAFLPLVSQILDDPASATGFDILYLGPLKALITDQAMRLKDMCGTAELPVVPWHGDVSQSVKARATKAPKGILLITPESLEAMFIRRWLEVPRLFRATRAIVVDELHSALDSERGVHMRSLLARLELVLMRPIRRVGLSATLGDMNLARAYLRQEEARKVQLIVGKGESELRLQLRGYVERIKDEDGPSAADGVADHIFRNLRGSDNLVFAGARNRVEVYADRLREMCECENLPQEFFAHHANLSREHRSFVEERIKSPNLPTTAVCTSTLELGIDIGKVKCVAQIGAPFSVASLRQRLGRSGRREGQAAILRQYSVEAKLESDSSFVDRMRLGLIRAIAMIELLGERWCEPPRPAALHLSTLAHQIMSVIAGMGGARANHLFHVLCQAGPFQKVDIPLFTEVLRAMGRADTGLIEQSNDGLLLLGPKGEKLVEHYSFYAVFQTQEEYRLISDGKELGTMPVSSMLAPGMHIIFSGRRWYVQEVDDRARTIVVTAAEAGVAPVFGGDPGIIHDRVIDRMFDVLEGDSRPPYLDGVSVEMLQEARQNFGRLGFATAQIVGTGVGSHILATRCGTVKTTTLALALGSLGYAVEQHDGFLQVKSGEAGVPLERALCDLAGRDAVDLFAHEPNLIFEKYHSFLTSDLLKRDALSTRLDLGSLQPLCKRFCESVSSGYA